MGFLPTKLNKFEEGQPRLQRIPKSPLLLGIFIKARFNKTLFGILYNFESETPDFKGRLIQDPNFSQTKFVDL